MTAVRRLVAAAAAVLLAGALGWSFLGAGVQQPLERRVTQVASSLRCPTCAGESAADSAAAPARAMRSIIRERLAAGQDPDQVRAHFVERYGRWVLLDPPASGADRLLQAAPWLAGLAATVVVLRVLRARPGAPHPVRRAGWAPAAVAIALGVAGAGGLAVVLAGGAPEGGGAAAAAAAGTAMSAGTAPSLGDQALLAEVEAHRAALDERPDDPAAAFRLGFALVRAGRHAEAEPVLAALVWREPAHREGLLLLGTSERALGREQWPATLRRFLALAPDHVAAPAVRRLVSAAP